MSKGGTRPLVTHVGTDEGWEHDDETGGLVRMLRDEGLLMVGLWEPSRRR